MKKICLIFDTPSLYREAIHHLIDNSFNCDWYFGDYNYKVKTYDIRSLRSSRWLHVIKPFGAKKDLYATEGLVKLLFNKHYKTYFLVGEPRNMAIWLFVLIKRLFFYDKKVYFWCHGWYGKESYTEAFIKKIVYKCASGIFTYGEYAKNLMIKEGFDGAKIHPIHNSLDYEKQLSLRQNIKQTNCYKDYFKTEYPVLIFIGRLTEIKRLDMLIESIRELRDNGENYNLVFVGDGPVKNALQAIAQKYNLTDRIWFYGACYDEKQNAELIYNADLCVAPGNVGLTAIHSMMFGTPVISHNNFKFQMPEFEAIKPNITGEFFQYQNNKSLSDTISQWFKMHKNERNLIRENCFKEIDSYWNPNYQIKILIDFLIP